jgi:hypothetical protein
VNSAKLLASLLRVSAPKLNEPSRSLSTTPSAGERAQRDREAERERQKGFRVMVNAALLEQRPQQSACRNSAVRRRSPRNNTRCMLYNIMAAAAALVYSSPSAASEKCCQIAFAQKGQKVRPAARNVIKQRELRMEREML